MSKEIEIWKDVPGFEGYYQASNTGHIRSVDRTITNSFGWTIRRKGKLLSECTDRDGYKYVCITKEGKGYRVHRLVSFAFIPNPDNKDQVNHKDGNPANNSVSNLEWNNASENLKHSFRQLNRPANKTALGKTGLLSGRTKPIGQYSIDGKIVKEYLFTQEAAVALGISVQCIRQCVTGRSKSAGGFKWKYLLNLPQ